VVRSCKKPYRSPGIFLSACSTGASENDKLIDDGVHLVSADMSLGLSGKVSDKHYVDVASMLYYKTLREEGMTDIAVNKDAVRWRRRIKKGDESFNTEPKGGFHWVPYIHFN
jgi:hypothetical protein